MSGASCGGGEKDRGRRRWTVSRVRFGSLTGAIGVVNDDGGVRQALRRDRSVTRPVIVAAA
jgi:hypothetical protein